MDANHPNDFEKLSQQEMFNLASWVATYLNRIKSFNERHTSHGMKHLFKRSENGFYVTNGAFKGAMLDCGFMVKDKTALNWVFNVSEKSRSFKNEVNK
ncbi:hypothetical protein G6549_19355 [Bacillus sp. MM2020_1]|nr:hypothetical protein [Bacillus sp. MM2020_1]